MELEMLVLANAEAYRGRLLVGILMENGVPAMCEGRPRWLRLRMDGCANCIPTGMVVDVRPCDMVSFRASRPDWTWQDGWVDMDPSTLRIKGRRRLDDLCNCTWAFENDAHQDWGEARQCFGEEYCLVLACDCSLVKPCGKGRNRTKAQLRFGFEGQHFELPVSDAELLGAMSDAVLMLAQRRSVRLLVSPCHGSEAFRRQPQVLAVIL